MAEMEEVVQEVKKLRSRVKTLEDKQASGGNVGEELKKLNDRLGGLEGKLKTASDEGSLFGLFDEEPEAAEEG